MLTLRKGTCTGRRKSGGGSSEGQRRSTPTNPPKRESLRPESRTSGCVGQRSPVLPFCSEYPLGFPNFAWTFAKVPEICRADVTRAVGALRRPTPSNGTLWHRWPPREAPQRARARAGESGSGSASASATTTSTATGATAASAAVPADRRNAGMASTHAIHRTNVLHTRTPDTLSRTRCCERPTEQQPNRST